MFKNVIFALTLLCQVSAFAGVDISRTWDWDHPEKSEQVFIKLAEQAKQNNETDIYLQLLTQVARAQGLQDKFDEANATLNIVQSELGETTLTAKIRYYLERGRVFNSSKQQDHAVPLFLIAFDLSLSNNDDLAIDAAHMLGIALPDSAQQVDWDEKALKIVSQSSDPKVKSWTTPIYYNMSWSLYDGKHFAEALEAFTKYVAFLEARGEKPDQEVLETITELKKHLGR